MIKIMNDTKKPMTLRVQHKGALPAITEVKPLEMIAIFNMEGDVFIKVWDNNIVLIQELEENKQVE